MKSVKKQIDRDSLNKFGLWKQVSDQILDQVSDQIFHQVSAQIFHQVSAQIWNSNEIR